MELLIFGRAYIRWEICVTKSIGLANSWKAKKNHVLLYRFCLILYLRAISKYKPPRVYFRRGDSGEGFLRYEFGGFYLDGLIHGGAYFRNLTVLTSEQADLFGVSGKDILAPFFPDIPSK